jgi:hypothetical protein
MRDYIPVQIRYIGTVNGNVTSSTPEDIGCEDSKAEAHNMVCRFERSD